MRLDEAEGMSIRQFIRPQVFVPGALQGTNSPYRSLVT
ncbi:hypothetical protein QFZ52_002182 [Arthrobacter woluwensis]|nr:hypothetical protein [Arthrobacter woluwensis]